MLKRFVVFLALLGLVAVACLGAQFQYYRTDRAVALFTNVTTETFSGLWVKFSADVTPIQTLGIGIDLKTAANKAGVLRFTGTIPPYTIWEIDWPLGGPTVTDAAWVRADGSEVPINVHAPVANMLISFPYLFLNTCPSSEWVRYLPVQGTFTAQGSYDPDGAPLTAYHWTWSDGVTADGPKVVRWFDEAGHYSVTLTVVNAKGYKDTVTRVFMLPQWICPCCQP